MENTRKQLGNKVEEIFQKIDQKKLWKKRREKTRLGRSGCISFNSEYLRDLRIRQEKTLRNNTKTLPPIRGYESLDWKFTEFPGE